ncbi:MAG: hypothetical protein AAF741_03575 [Bacteroidota bacterium]
MVDKEEFWGNKVNVTREAAAQQVAIWKSFSSEKRARLAGEMISWGVQRTRDFIKEKHPYFSEE